MLLPKLQPIFNDTYHADRFTLQRFLEVAINQVDLLTRP